VELAGTQLRDVLKGNLVARYYYVYAIDYDRGGEWMGQAYMCTRDKELRSAASAIAWRAAMTAPAFRGRHRRTARLDRAVTESASSKSACRERSPFAGTTVGHRSAPRQPACLPGGAADSSGRRAINAERK